MAARRGKSQARRSGGGSQGTPGWIWLLAGVALGLVIAAVFMLRQGGDTAPGPRPNPAATAPAPRAEEPVAQEPAAPRRPRYDFYTVLPERESVVPDAELSARAQAEQQQAPPPDQAPGAPAAPPPATAGERYVLQAGAFRSNSDAEALRARIALSGLVARVESARIDNDTVYRVRLGPYTSASQIAGAREQLAANGIESVAIRDRSE
ncbi:MAG: SPOR domain-containing protein [Lysobacteraceae bacterium]